jgi:hypothetical protein
LSALAPAHPVSATAAQSDWDVINSRSDRFAALDRCSNGAPKYTAFIPYEEFLYRYFEDERLEISEFAATLAMVRNMVGVYLVNGSVGPRDIEHPDTYFLTTRTGRQLVKSNSMPFDDPVVLDILYLNNQFIAECIPVCNGAVYFLHGPLYGDPGVDVSCRAPFVPLNAQGVPRLDSRPYEMFGEIDSLLPETV